MQETPKLAVSFVRSKEYDMHVPKIFEIEDQLVIE
jgi:hypothetical protein